MGETMKPSHPDSFTLLRLAAGELDELGVRRVRRHLEGCSRCRRSLDEIERLDRGLREHREEVFAGEAGGTSLPAGDPFATRPEPRVRRPSRHGFGDPEFTLRWAAAARDAAPLRDRILASPPDVLEPLLERLALEGLVERYGLGFALDEAPLQISRGPVGFRPLAELSLRRLRRERLEPPGDQAVTAISEADFAYPLVEIAGRAHLLDGIICNWTGEYDRGAASFLNAWTSFAAGLGSDLTVATVEIHESQRRCFAGDALGGLALASRALRTFEELQDTPNVARSLYAVGLALGDLERDEEAIGPLRRAAGIFAATGLWRPYATAVVCLGTSLLYLNRLPDARREYLRALRLASRGDQPAVHALIRCNLGLTLFRSGDYARAAHSFRAAADLYGRLELLSDAAVCGLHLAECLARLGRVDAARRCIEAIEGRLARTPNLDPAILREFSRQLSGDLPDYQRFEELRGKVEEAIRLDAARSG